MRNGGRNGEMGTENGKMGTATISGGKWGENGDSHHFIFH